MNADSTLHLFLRFLFSLFAVSKINLIFADAIRYLRLHKYNLVLAKLRIERRPLIGVTDNLGPFLFLYTIMIWGIILAILIIWVIVSAVIAVVAVLGARLGIWVDKERDEWEDPEDIV